MKKKIIVLLVCFVTLLTLCSCELDELAKDANLLSLSIRVDRNGTAVGNFDVYYKEAIIPYYQSVLDETESTIDENGTIIFNNETYCRLMRPADNTLFMTIKQLESSLTDNNFVYVLGDGRTVNFFKTFKIKKKSLLFKDVYTIEFILDKTDQEAFTDSVSARRITFEIPGTISEKTDNIKIIDISENNTTTVCLENQNTSEITQGSFKTVDKNIARGVLFISTICTIALIAFVIVYSKKKARSSSEEA